MADEKSREESRRKSKSGADADTGKDDGDLSPASSNGAGAALRDREVSAGLDTYLLTARPKLAPLGAGISRSTLADVLRSEPGIEHLRTLSARGIARVSMAAVGGSPDVEVVRMSFDHAELLAQQFGESVRIERVVPLSCGPVGPVTVASAVPGLSIAALPGGVFTVTCTVVGSDNAPLAGAEVSIFGSRTDAKGMTDGNGQVRLSLAGETTDSIRGLVASPPSGHWMTFVRSPRLDPAFNNVIKAIPLSQQYPNFPQEEIWGWGASAVGVESIAQERRGQGVRVGIVDSGIAIDHPDLDGQVDGGHCYAPGQNADAWQQDEVGHGTHVAGVIAGREGQAGIRGVAPGARLRIYKIFPGGSFPELFEALQQCMEDRVDLINLSLGAEGFQTSTADAIRAARQQGIACIVAAGNSAGPVQFPGSLNEVLTVSAIGRNGTFPPESWHANEAIVGGGLVVSTDGFFTPIFTCFGAEVKVCAPGVAVVSCFPPDTYAAMDGTSMATPFVTGLAALVLAHHPDFQPGGAFSARNAARVDRLFEIMQQGARPVAIGDSALAQPRIGSGLASSDALNVPAYRSTIGPAMAGLQPAEVQSANGASGSGQLSEEELERLISAVLAMLRPQMTGRRETMVIS